MRSPRASRPARFPLPGASRLSGGSPRYQLYPTADGKLVACGALEQRFWLAFCKAIGLPAEFADDIRDPAASKAAVAAIIGSRSAQDWRPILAQADCCATIVASLDEAVRDPHFVARGLFRHLVAGPSGATMPALPVPIAPEFRAADGPLPFPSPQAGRGLGWGQSASPRMRRGCDAGCTPSRITRAAQRSDPVDQEYRRDRARLGAGESRTTGCG